MAISAVIDLTVKKPDFKTMKSEIKELTVAAQQAVIAFGEFSPEAAAAERNLAAAKDQMEDFNDRVKAVNPDRFSQISTVVQGVASGFAAAQGAMALFGADSENLQKTMVKLQGAMALAQGLEGLGKIRQQFGAIFTDVVSGAKKAFAAIKAGIGSTGIGLLVVAVGALALAFIEIFNNVKAANKELSFTDDELKSIGDSTGKVLSKIEILTEKVKNQTLSEKERTKALKELQEEYPNYFKNLGNDINNTKNLTTAKDKLSEALIREAKTRALQDRLAAVFSESAQEEIDLTTKLARNRETETRLTKELTEAKVKDNVSLINAHQKGLTSVQSNVADISARLKEINTERTEASKTIIDLINKEEIAIKKLGGSTLKEAEKGNEDSKKLGQEKVKEKTSAAEEIRAAEQANTLAAIKDEEARAKKQAEFVLENAKENIKVSKFSVIEKNKLLELAKSAHELKLAEIEKTFRDKRIEDAKKAEEDLKQFMVKSASDEEQFINEGYNKLKLLAEKEITNAQALADKLNEIEIARLNNLIQAKKDAGLSTTELELQLAEKTKEISAKSAENQIANENSVREAKENLYKASIDLANSIISLAGEQTKTGKALALGVIAADTAMAISGALNVTQKASPDNVVTGGLAGAAKFIALAAMIMTNAKRARDILKGGQPSASQGPQMSAGGMPQMAAPQVSSSLPQVEGFSQRVFVTEGDITRTQNRVQNIKKVSVVK